MLLKKVVIYVDLDVPKKAVVNVNVDIDLVVSTKGWYTCRFRCF